MIEDGGDLYHPSRYYSKDKTPLDQIAEKPAEILEAVLETGKVKSTVKTIMATRFFTKFALST